MLNVPDKNANILYDFDLSFGIFSKKKKSEKIPSNRISFTKRLFHSEIPPITWFFVKCYDFRKQFHEKNTSRSFAIKVLVKENNTHRVEITEIISHSFLTKLW